ncbi:MAG TPA: ankyrin repeat domain-containing protein, partial [Armatimonadota bacterium]|nr:ankyrin repeat domain-containing protein [Armatimonadota bacterium]
MDPIFERFIRDFQWAGGDRILQTLRHFPTLASFADDEGATGLHHAAGGGRLAVAEALLAAGADPNKTDRRGETPLRRAAIMGMREAAELLVRWGAGHDVFSVAGIGDEDQIRALLQDNPAKIRDRDWSTRTPLHFAAAAGNEAAVSTLIAFGAVVGDCDRFEMTPLREAAAHGKRATADLLASYGGELDVPSAAALGMSEHLSVLLRQSPQRIGEEIIPHGTPLHWAARAGQTSTADVLLDHGAAVDSLCFTQHTPLHAALEYEMPQMALALLERGANPLTVSVTGSTPL